MNRRLSQTEAREFLWARVPHTAEIGFARLGADVMLLVTPGAWRFDTPWCMGAAGLFSQQDLVEIVWKVRNPPANPAVLPLTAALLGHTLPLTAALLGFLRDERLETHWRWL